MEQLEEEFFIKQLKNEIVRKVGFTINEFQDCKSLSDELAQLKIIISAHTVARFFGLLKEEHRPYTSTLNLFSNYLGLDSFQHFKKETVNSNNFSLKNQMGTFTSGDFSFIALELSIQQCDWKNVQAILETYQIDKLKNDLSMFLGSAVRHHNQKDAFLKTLVDIENGRHLYYEAFVDEDNPGNYYSNALSSHYAQIVTSEESKIFNICFINAQKAYQNQRIDKKEIQALIDSKFDLQKLHFHQVSRIFEIRILVLGKGNSGKLVSDNVIFEALELLPFYIFYEQCWILARIIKALSFTKKLNNALKNPEFSNAISLTYFKMEGKVQSIAELIIQFTYHALLRKNEDQIFAPNRIQEKHLNETNARIAIESATALLYAEQPIKNILEKNLLSFAEKSGNAWVLEMLK
jgi:hypothetical protein